MKPSFIVRSRARGIARRGLSAAALLGVAALPILSMGVTVPSAISVRQEEQIGRLASLRLDQRNVLAQELERYREGDVLDQLRLLNVTLHGMIPMGLRPLDEFGSLREICDLRGIEVKSIRLAQTHATSVAGEPAEGGAAPYTVMVDEVVISIVESPESSLALIDDLRAAGFPTVVIGFDMTRSGPRDTRFKTELRLGFLRRTARAPGSEGTAENS